ncbi:19198_t:CDS:2, partial [Gigaspora rosea]
KDLSCDLVCNLMPGLTYGLASVIWVFACRVGLLCSSFVWSCACHVGLSCGVFRVETRTTLCCAKTNVAALVSTERT